MADYDYSCDLADQLTGETHHGESHDYTYDDVGQILAADHASATDEAYIYDANGNRIDGGMVVGPNNQVLSDGTFDYTYDAEGNLVTKTEISSGEITEFTYDHRNRLTHFERRDAIGVVLAEADYTYDLFGRRITTAVC